jgi:heme oxygenase
MSREPTREDYLDHLETCIKGQLEQLESLIDSKNWDDALSQLTVLEEAIEKRKGEE